jgi:hypothetical protein
MAYAPTPKQFPKSTLCGNKPALSLYRKAVGVWGMAGNRGAEVQLQKEFKRLIDLLGVGRELELVWMPKAFKGLSGEVKNGKLYIYEEGLDKASHALRHELVDYLITSKIVEPLVGLINALIKSREVEIYRAKEDIVEKLAKLLG